MGIENEVKFTVLYTQSGNAIQYLHLDEPSGNYYLKSTMKGAALFKPREAERVINNTTTTKLFMQPVK